MQNPPPGNKAPQKAPPLTLEQKAERAEFRLRQATAGLKLARVRTARQALKGYQNVLGGYGMPGQPAFRGAQVTRLGGPLGPTGGAANRHLTPKVRSDLRAYAQHLYRNSVIVRTTIDRYVQMTGGEWRVQAEAADAAVEGDQKSGDQANSGTAQEQGGDDPVAETAADRFNAAAEALFNKWAERACDAAGMRSLNDLLDMVVRCGACDGDAGLVLTAAGTLQPFESEQLGGPAARKGLKAGQPEGVELDASGRVIAYLFARWRDDGLIDPTGYDRVDALNVIYWCNAPRPSQHRGEPLLAAAFGDIEQVEDFDEGTSVAAKLAAYVVALRTVSDPERASTLGGTTLDMSDGTRQYQQDFELGTIFNLGEGEKLEQMKSEHPSAGYREFMSVKLRKVAAMVGLALEQVWLDFTQTNFHSAKSAQAQMRRNVGSPMAWRERALRRIYRWRIGRAIAAGELDPAGIEPGTALDCRWVPPPMPKLDPLKETAAVKMALESNTTTLKDQADADNASWDDRLRQRGRERRMEIKENVLPPTATPQLNGVNAIGATGTGDPLMAEALATSDTPPQEEK